MSELGNRLKQARDEKNMSLDDLQEITKIQKRYLIGIEEGNYAMMPGKFYARAFIKQYAEAVDLDPEMLFEEYKNDVPSTHKEDVPEQLSRVRTHKQLPKSASKFLDFLPKLLTIAVVVVVAILLWLWRQDAAKDNANNENNVSEANDVEFEKVENTTTTDDEANEEEPAQEEAPQEETTEPEEPETAAQSLSVVEGSTTTYELSGAEKFQLEVVAKDRTWVRVRNGKGKTFYGEEIPKGETKVNDLTAESEITIRVGNVPGTDLKINGELLQYQDTKTTPQDITIIYKKE
ncbi:helix-turn-helix domain-containing protein [Metabacillus litoralis]|uniref:helix-turn-helix domain-containing protein n=1 Tax=Metabacillus litoralis TaxID=152268 RepID=UPI0013CF1B46|nr:helix-turn-helix domain-containing protein [Metabacillus litoralis]